MKNRFLAKLARMNRKLWGRKPLDYHRLSRKNLKLAPDKKEGEPPGT